MSDRETSDATLFAVAAISEIWKPREGTRVAQLGNQSAKPATMEKVNVVARRDALFNAPKS